MRKPTLGMVRPTLVSLTILLVLVAVWGLPASAREAPPLAPVVTLTAYAEIVDMQEDTDCPNFDYSNWPQCLENWYTWEIDASGSDGPYVEIHYEGPAHCPGGFDAYNPPYYCYGSPIWYSYTTGWYPASEFENDSIFLQSPSEPWVTPGPFSIRATDGSSYSSWVDFGPTTQ